MKFANIFLLNSFLSLSAYAQEPQGATKYFEERAKGDASAEKYRHAFNTSVCEAAIEAFCPGQKIGPKQSCFKIQKDCGAPKTEVVKRFISKYGVGHISADRDVIPTIKKIFKVLKEIEDHRKDGRDGISHSIRTRIPFIAKTTNLSETQIENNLIQFAKQFFPHKLKMITIDYWGYFQQQVPARPGFKFDEVAQSGSLTLNFRWCSQQYRFIDEKNRMVEDVLSSAVIDPDEVRNFRSASSYQSACNKLPELKGER